MKILKINDKELETFKATWLHTDWHSANVMTIDDWLEYQRRVYNQVISTSGLTIDILVEGDNFTVDTNVSNLMAELVDAVIEFDNDVTFKGTLEDTSIEKINSQARIFSAELKGVYYAKPSTISFQGERGVTKKVGVLAEPITVYAETVESYTYTYTYASISTIKITQNAGPASTTNPTLGTLAQGESAEVVSINPVVISKNLYLKVEKNGVQGYVLYEIRNFNGSTFYGELTQNGSSDNVGGRSYILEPGYKILSIGNVSVYGFSEDGTEYMLCTNLEGNITFWVKTSDMVAAPKEDVSVAIDYRKNFFLPEPLTVYTTSEMKETQSIIEPGKFNVKYAASMNDVPAGFYDLVVIHAGITAAIYSNVGKTSTEVTYSSLGYIEPSKALQFKHTVFNGGVVTPMGKHNFNVGGNAIVPLFVQVSCPMPTGTTNLTVNVFENDKAFLRYELNDIDTSILEGDEFTLIIDGENGLCVLNNINAVEGLIDFEFPTITAGNHNLSITATCGVTPMNVAVAAVGRWL